MRSQNVRNLLFDLGNVIIDLDIEKASAELNKLFRQESDRTAIERIFIEYECGRISTDIFIHTLLRQCKSEVQAIDVVKAWNSILIGIPVHRLEMLKMLRERFNVYLLSNTNALHLEWIHRYLKKEHGVDHFEKQFFDQAYYSHLVGDRKPLTSIYKHIIDDAFMTPSLTLYMDDVKENIDVASGLGFETYQVSRDKDIAEYLKEEGYF